MQCWQLVVIYQPVWSLLQRLMWLPFAAWQHACPPICCLDYVPAALPALWPFSFAASPRRRHVATHLQLLLHSSLSLPGVPNCHTAVVPA
jgi:hypothetical protein